MPERWERELRKLGGVDPNERLIRERASRGPSADRKPRGNALVAGIVAGAVAAAGIATLWQLDRNPDGIGTENESSPTLGSSGSVVVDIQRSSEETGDPEAIARFGSQEQWMCPDGWSVVNPDGTTDEILFDCGQDAVFQAPVGTPIEVTGDFATVNISTRLSGEGSTGAPTDRVADLEAGTVVTYAYDVTWDDGSEASFWLLLTVQNQGPTTEPGIVVWIYGLGERSTDVPIITMTYGGETKRGCTEGFEWTLPDGTRVDEASGRSGSILVQCSYDPLFRVPPGIPITVEVPTATAVFATRTTTPFYEGRDGFGASVRWLEGSGEFTVTFEVMGSPGSVSIDLDCAVDDQVEFVTPDGPRILPGGSAYIRGNMSGFRQTDVIEQMTPGAWWHQRVGWDLAGRTRRFGHRGRGLRITGRRCVSRLRDRRRLRITRRSGRAGCRPPGRGSPSLPRGVCRRPSPRPSSPARRARRRRSPRPG